MSLASHLARTLKAPMAALSFVDRDRQRFKASAGLTVRQTPRDIAFCSHVVYRGADVVVGDALADPLFQGNSLVIGAPHVRFYAGSPIRSSSGHPIGALCVLDTQARVFEGGPGPSAALCSLGH